MISTQTRSSRKGFSLIEVAIALVIFVIGALAIIRIFPGALNVIINNGDQQIATNLNRSVAARLKTESAVPTSTFNILVNADKTLRWTTADNTNHTADFGDIEASVIGVPRFNETLPSPDDAAINANNSALSRFRGIQGEQAKVITVVEGGVDVSYALTQFPISYERINNGTTEDLLAPTISQDYTVRNARINKLGQVTFTDVTIIDVNGKVIRLVEATDMRDTAKNTVLAKSMVYVSYRYYNTFGKVWGVSEQAIPITAPLTLTGPMAGSVTVAPPTTTRGAIAPYVVASPDSTGVVAEVIDVKIKRYVGPGEFGPSGSPAVASAGYPTLQQIGDARRGVVRLTGPISTPTVSIDYIADWSFLMQQGTPLLTPDDTPVPLAPLAAGEKFGQIALGAPFIEDQANIGVYSLLVDLNTTSAGKLDLYRSRFGEANADPLQADKLVRPTEDELRAGKVTFITDASTVGSRVAYKTRDRWVQQLSVAASSYKPYTRTGGVTGGGGVVVEPWRDYYLGNDNYLYFHAGEAGKTISISYSYNDVLDAPNLPTPLPDKKIVDRPFVIESQLLNAAGLVPAGFSTRQVVRVQLQTAQGASFPTTKNTANIDLTSIQDVKGNSVTVRTAYLNGSKYAQTLLTSNRGTN